MQKGTITIIAFLSIFITVSGISPVFASSQLEVTIDPNSDTAIAKMTYQRSINIDYSDGGDLQNMNGLSKEISFSADSSNPGVQSLISKINSYILSKGSQAQITDLTVEYKSLMTGRSTSMSVDYTIVLHPTIQNLVIKQGSGNNPTLVDVDWRGFGATGPVVINTLAYGDVEINLPISTFERFTPSLALSLKSSDAAAIMSTILMDADEIKEQPIGNWHFLFDPTGIGADASQYGFQTGSVISSFTMGESSFREGLIREQIREGSVNIDKTYKVTSYESSGNASIDLIGFANRDVLGTSEIFGVTPNAPEGYASTSTGEFPAFILYGMAGMAAIGGAAMMLISKRKLNKEKGHYDQTGIDPTQLTGVQTSASSGGYQTVRGEAQVKGLEDYNQHRSYYDEEKPQVEEKSEDKPSSKGGAMPKGFESK
ncbi:hypothetical protein HX827_01530 [Marine Group I thaumarchaeote]|uniref:Uncharacterized protein n=1 Tax=Marine Group I thaumarchaeote TaxID=2511932 RepID=A0A7K4NSU0_9ARCH|nr:hypothetical protein [Marine Group I thaumarchaeote]